MSLSTVRQSILLDGQTAIARKVFDFVPIQDAWTAHQIAQTMHRTTRALMDLRVLQACLSALTNSGLVCEAKPGLYQRKPLRVSNMNEPIPMKAATSQQPPRRNPTQPPETARPQSAVDLLSELAERARTLATDLEAAAELIVKEQEEKEANLQKLAQLQSILKSLA